MLYARCIDCNAEYRTQDIPDQGICPACKRAEDRIYLNDPTPYVDEVDRPWPWSKYVMRERLGVNGDVDE